MWIVRGVCDFRNLVLEMENKLTAQSWRIVRGGGSMGKVEWVVSSECEMEYERRFIMTTFFINYKIGVFVILTH